MEIVTNYPRRRCGAGRQLLAAVMADAESWFDFINTHAPEMSHRFYYRR
ncbi:hypothetical protein [Pluralibacter gergoviae]|nr:hypothetical protein [Pluralibacter gergoviae]